MIAIHSSGMIHRWTGPDRVIERLNGKIGYEVMAVMVPPLF